MDVGELRLDAKGPVHDRRFMIVDATGRFVTQREVHELALVTPHLSETELRLEAPGRAPLSVPLGGSVASRAVTVWRYSAPALDLGAAASEWLSALLSRTVHLVAFDEHAMRPANPAYAPAGSSAGRFSDGYPVLLTSVSSLDDLNARLSEALSMNRFRPNVVIEGSEAWAEDTFTEVTLGEVRCVVTKPCERCVVTTVDQATGAAGKEPLATLAKFRKRDGAVHFGVNLVHARPGVVRVGDPVTVLG